VLKLLLATSPTVIQRCGDVSGVSRVLKQLFSHTSAADGSMLGVFNEMTVTELLDNGQSLDAIVGCLKVYLPTLLNESVFVCKLQEVQVLSVGEF